MRLGTLDSRLVVLRHGRLIDVERASGGALPSDPCAALADTAAIRAWLDRLEPAAGVPLAGERLGPPVPRPGQVFAIGLNYRPHAEEAGFQAPEAPLVFTKFPSCITGPDTEVTLPPGRVDWEVEIVAVVGSGGRDIAPERAWDALAGLTLGQDLSERVLQSAGAPAQFSLGKSFPGFGPIGPTIVTPEEFPDRDDIGFECRLGDEVMQRGRTLELIFPVAELVTRLSAVCELRPGDLIFTGTPGGVGNRMTPPRYVQPGETLISRAEVIGSITQRFR